jgi:hypothetical protein
MRSWQERELLSHPEVKQELLFHHQDKLLYHPQQSPEVLWQVLEPRWSWSRRTNFCVSSLFLALSHSVQIGVNHKRKSFNSLFCLQINIPLEFDPALKLFFMVKTTYNKISCLLTFFPCQCHVAWSWSALSWPWIPGWAWPRIKVKTGQKVIFCCFCFDFFKYWRQNTNITVKWLNPTSRKTVAHVATARALRVWSSSSSSSYVRTFH